MSNYTWLYIQQHPQEVKRLLGITYEQLEQLIEQGKILHQIKLDYLEKQKVRIIKSGGGKSAKLSLEEQIVEIKLMLEKYKLKLLRKNRNTEN
jgi:PHP family Zn ribbon phosphoesterase